MAVVENVAEAQVRAVILASSEVTSSSLLLHATCIVKKSEKISREQHLVAFIDCELIVNVKNY